jgi:hypothetical protein
MRMNLTGSCTMEMESKPPFRSVGHCLTYATLNNPARLKPINLLEPEGGGSGHAADFSGDTPMELFSSILHGITCVLESKCTEAVVAFELKYKGDRTEAYSVEDIAETLHRSTKTIYRYLNQIHDDLEREFARRELIEFEAPPNDCE